MRTLTAPEPVALPSTRRGARVRPGLVKCLTARGSYGITIHEIARHLGLTCDQVRAALHALRVAGHVVVLGRVPGNRRPQGGGRGRNLYAWAAPGGAAGVTRAGR